MTISSSLLHYQDLSPAAKTVARSRVVAFEEAQYKKSVAHLKQNRPASSINTLVNDPYHIQRVVNRLQAVRKYQRASQHEVERCIEENLCMFDADGRYYLFIQKAFY
ncbi:hypothetical protein JQ760_028315 (plasmid) [Klebsiella pneumoniae]|uniref:hypothetical protein n=1 Tax=Klebsiella pneumoniae TaxID=573 RepID=UPI001FADBCD8|nr:hypothetical protein [Klebsiella pneumoniae]MCI8108432.1 hypothetical protein [Klebsiella pneumoniae]